MQRDHIPIIMDTFFLNTSICNKCFNLKGRDRGKQPYFLTQCAHIFCQDCWQKADKQCTLCGNNDIVTVELSEQLPAKVRPLFEPIAETLKIFSLEMLRVENFRINQWKITMQRFMELEKKYDMLKRQYWTMLHDMKTLTRKYIDLKAEKDKVDKILSIQVQRNLSRRMVNTVQTPPNSNIYRSNHHFSSGYSSQSQISSGPRSVDVTSVQSAGLKKKQHITVDGFRVPMKRKDVRSSHNTKTSSSTNIFMK